MPAITVEDIGLVAAMEETRRKGMIEGLERALACFPKPTSTTQWNPQDEIRAEIERLKAES